MTSWLVDTAKQKTWSVYLLRCADNSLYTGIALDVELRLKAHRKGPGGAKYLKGRGPLQLVFKYPVGDRARASRVEYLIKRLPKREKERLVAAPSLFRELVDSAFAEPARAAADPGGVQVPGQDSQSSRVRSSAGK